MNDLIARCTTCGETNRALFCSNGFHGPQSVDARIAALEADNARLMGLVKEAGDRLSIAVAYLSEVPHHPAMKIASTLAKIKEATDAE